MTNNPDGAQISKGMDGQTPIEQTPANKGLANLRPWKPGQSGNPAGRPKGARSKIEEVSLRVVLESADEHLSATLEEMRQKDPSGYVKAVLSILPKESKVDMTSRKEESLTEEQARMHAEEYLARLGRKQPSAEQPDKLHAVDEAGLSSGPAASEHSKGA